jgi:predicted nucleotidyltransferase
MDDSKAVLLEPIVTRARDDDDVLALVVFGSFTKDGAEPYNDIDVCLFLYPEKTSGTAKKTIEYLDLYSEYDIHFFSDLPLYIKKRVLEEGKILINKNYDLLFDIYIKTIKDWGLFRPHYQTFLEAVKHG